MPVSSCEFLDIQATVECKFTLKRVRDMIITYSHIHRTDKYSQRSSIICPVWLNGLQTKWLRVQILLLSLKLQASRVLSKQFLEIQATLHTVNCKSSYHPNMVIYVTATAHGCDFKHLTMYARRRKI